MILLNEQVIIDLLYPERRGEILVKISQFMKEIAKNIEIEYRELRFKGIDLTSPILIQEKRTPSAPFLLCIGAQHNEFNGTFGILDFLSADKVSLLKQWQEGTGGGFCFIPILNLTGFLEPIVENKWGYYVKGVQNSKVATQNWANCNRFWDKILELDIFEQFENDIPEENRIVGELLYKSRYADSFPQAPLIVLDFHETSLPYRTRKEMAQNFNLDYAVNDSWIRKLTFEDALSYGKLPFTSEINLKIIEDVKSALFKMNSTIEDTTFYFCFYSPYSEEMAKFIDQRLQKKFAPYLWYAHRRTVSHGRKIDGCFVSANMSHPWMSALEIEMRKCFFNLEEERAQYEKNAFYGKKLLKILRMNTELASNAIGFMFDYLALKT